MEDIYHITPDVLGSGFYRPPSPYNGGTESYCNSYASSEYSAHNDYSIPVPPPGGRSDLGQDGFVEGIPPYEHAPSSQVLPWAPQDLGANDNIYDSFGIVPPSTPFTRTAFSYHGYPTSRSLEETLTHAGGRASLGLTEAGSSESNGAHESTICWPDSGHSRCDNGYALSPLNDQVPMTRQDELQSPWNPMAVTSISPLGMIPGTIAPSDSLMDAFVPMNSDGLNPSRVDDTQGTFVQTPQEVSFRRSSSPDIKVEHDSDERPRQVGSRMETRMYVRSTGAKGVKKEQGIRGTKKKAQPKFKKHYVRARGCDQVLEVKMEQGIYTDKATGLAYREGGVQSQYACEKCGKRFKRPEHRKRHLRTHKPTIVARCDICNRGFNRNDNCISHYETHIRKPGKNDGKNDKISLGWAGVMIRDRKIFEKLYQKYGHLEEEMDLSP
jgi:hypothetical protein